MPAQGATLAPSVKPTVTVRVASTVSPESLSKIIQSIGGRYGCQTCGILGVDVRLSADPVEFQDIAKIPGVQSVFAE